MKPESLRPAASTLDPVDADPQETAEWRDAFESLVRTEGSERGRFILETLGDLARDLRVVSRALPYSAYRNTIDLSEQGAYPGDLAIEERLVAIIRWNALAMVARANAAYGELGGHIASLCIGRGNLRNRLQPFLPGTRSARWRRPGLFPAPFGARHLCPGLPRRPAAGSRSGPLSTGDHGGRQGVRGLSSYPHPWLMPDFWQVPTGSMGLGPISAIYQARFMRYLAGRGQIDTRDRHVWGVFGDGEMDEPESIAGLTLAAREKLDNLTFIVNCNLQRLDGPVRGNGQIIQELEALFHGAGWNVIKVLWGSDWDGLFARDHGHVLLRRFAATVDGKYQTLGRRMVPTTWPILSRKTRSWPPWWCT